MSMIMETATVSTASPTTSKSTCSVLSSSRDSSRKKANSRSKDQVRSRLLNNLGIFNGAVDNAPNPAIARKIKIIRAMGLGGCVIPPKPETQQHVSTQIVDNENIRPKINFSQITHEPLKFKVADDQPTFSSKTKNGKPHRRKICFNDSVSVAHIPMRTEYSDRVRSRMWSNRYEIHENASRNAIEFQAEGWDWRTVTEDEGMFVCTSSGELIHPVHCQQ